MTWLIPMTVSVASINVSVPVEDIHTLWFEMRYIKGLKGTNPIWLDLDGSVCGESSTFLVFTIFSTNISQASRNSPVPSGEEQRCLAHKVQLTRSRYN